MDKEGKKVLDDKYGVPDDMETFAAMVADKQDNPTLGELAKEFPNKTYKELENYRSEDRNEEANQIPLTEDQKKLVEHLEAAQTSLTESQQKQEELEPIPKGVCVAGEARRDREEMNPKIRELEEALENALAINKSHQKLNGHLQKRVSELEKDNKKLAHDIENRIVRMRKSGL